jgi:hypothetical protein
MLAFLFALTLLGQPSSPVFGAAWDDLRFPVTTLLLGAGNPPSLVVWRDDGAGSAGVLALEFSDEVTVNEEQVWFVAQMPHTWREGTSVNPHIHWGLEDATDCNARFCMEYAIANVGDAWPATTTTQCADCPSGATATDQQVCGIFPSTLAMTGYEISVLLSVRLYRNSGHANDTCVGKDALVHTADIHYEKARPGSRTELTH